MMELVCRCRCHQNHKTTKSLVSCGAVKLNCDEQTSANDLTWNLKIEHIPLQGAQPHSSPHPAARVAYPEVPRLSRCQHHLAHSRSLLIVMIPPELLLYTSTIQNPWKASSNTQSSCFLQFSLPPPLCLTRIFPLSTLNRPPIILFQAPSTSARTPPNFNPNTFYNVQIQTSQNQRTATR